MSTDSAHLVVSGIGIDVIYKDIKHLHIGVYPPNGRVRVAVPGHVDADVVRLAVVRRLPWIKRQRRLFESVERMAEREMATGESHYVWGRRLRLRVMRRPGRPHFETDGGYLLLFVAERVPVERRRQLLDAWYREELRKVIPSLLEPWAERMGVEVPQWRIRRMKTKWGSCNREAGRVLFNSALAIKHPDCLEYVIVHELIHLKVRHHGAPFSDLMDTVMPRWRELRDQLNQSPLAPFSWPTLSSSGEVD